MNSDAVGEESAEELEHHGEITNSPLYTETMHWAHYPAMIMSIILAGFGILIAYTFYQWKKVDVDKMAENIKFLYSKKSGEMVHC